MKKTLKNRIVAGLLALMMAITTWMPAEQVKADDSYFPAATNTTFANARELQFGTTIAENLTQSDRKRYYKFTVDEASELNIGANIENSRAGFTIYVYDALKTQVYCYGKSHSNWITDFSTDSIFVTGGQYYLEIEIDERNESAISFIVNADTMGETFTETQDSNNDTVSAASAIELRKKYKGALIQNDEVDYYTFTVPAAGRINFNMTNSTNGTLKYVIYDSDVNASYIKTADKGAKVSEYITLAKGTYYLAITKNNSSYGVGSYNFNIDYVANVPNAPKIKSVKNTAKKKMTVKWGKVTGADGYELQYSAKSNFKSKVVTKKLSASKTSANYSKLTKGKTYYVRMRAYVSVDGVKKYSKWSSKKSVKIKK